MFLRRSLAGLLLAVIGSSAFAASGSVDRAYANGSGVRIVDFSATAGVVAGASVVQAFPATQLDAQGRLVLAAVVISGNSFLGIGVTRLLADGSDDTSFGTQGQILMPFSTPFGTGIYAVRVDGSGRPLLALQVDDGTITTWRACRLTLSGALDTSFFGTGCTSVEAYNGAQLKDMVVLANGNIWMVGAGPSPSGSGTKDVIVVARVDLAALTTIDEVFEDVYSLSARRALADTSGEGATLVGSSNPTGSSYRDVSVMHLSHDEFNFSVEWLKSVGFDQPGPTSDDGTCIDRQSDGRLLIGVDVEDSPGNHSWGTFRMDTDGNFDPTYAPAAGLGGRTLDQISNVGAYGSNISLYDCAVDSAGGFDLAGVFSFADTLAPGNPSSSVGAVVRMNDGVRDSGFGGAAALPGTGHTPALMQAGVAMHSYRSLALGHPRFDALDRLQPTRDGRLLVVGPSQRIGFNSFDIAVMKLYGDALFGDGFGH